MKTLKLFTSEVIPGMTVAEDVYTFNNQLIIPKGSKLSDKIISRLKFYSISQIIVETKEEEAPSIPSPVLLEPTNFPAFKVSNTAEFKSFKDEMIQTANSLQKDLNAIVANRAKIEEEELLKKIYSILNHSRNGTHIFDMLHCLRDYDDQTYIHSINVALICHVIGSWSKFSKKDLETVTLCGLLHDIGKIVIPDTLIRKPSKLTDSEYSIVKTHTVKGYEVLKNQNINIHIKMAALMHHERCDGSGYPLGMKGDQIDRFAKVVMIADTYDAMTSARIYRGPLSPFEAISIYETEGLTKFDPKYLMTFLDHIYEFYQNAPVRLNDQREGIIVMIDRNHISKPLVKVGDSYLDLLKEPDLYIECFL